MIRIHSITLSPLDYELVHVTRDPAPPRPWTFIDAHTSHDPVPRLAAGYLMLDAADDGVAVHSHGHHVGSITPSGDDLIVALRGPMELIGGIVRSRAGIALVPDDGAVVALDGDAAVLTGAGVLVHGPADEKIDNRIALLTSLRRVGGRHG